MKSLEYIKNKYPDITKKITREQVKSSMGKSFDEIVELYYSYLSKEKAVNYAREAFNKNIENLLKYGGVLYTNSTAKMIKTRKEEIYEQ